MTCFVPTLELYLEENSPQGDSPTSMLCINTSAEKRKEPIQRCVTMSPSNPIQDTCLNWLFPLRCRSTSSVAGSLRHFRFVYPGWSTCLAQKFANQATGVPQAPHPPWVGNLRRIWKSSSWSAALTFRHRSHHAVCATCWELRRKIRAAKSMQDFMHIMFSSCGSHRI